MEYPAIFTYLFLIFSLLLFLNPALATTYYVDDEADCNDTSGNPYYCTIQTAINSAGVADTINVADGLYSEAITLDKTNLTLQATGTAVNTIIDATNAITPPPYMCAVKVTADNVTLNGFTVKYHWLYGMKLGGIKLDSVSGCTISNNIGDVGMEGIYLDYSNANTISQNNFSNNNVDDAICLQYSDSNTIISNDVSSVVNSFGNPGTGIFIYYSDSNLISNNIVNSDGKGIYLQLTSHYNEIYKNEVKNNKRGIQIENAYENKIYNNTAISNNSAGILLENAPENEIYNNPITKNRGDGIFLFGIPAYGNKIYNNDITSNVNGIKAGNGCHDNRIYHNTILNNTGYGIYDYTGDRVDAECNWWGDITPDDQVSGNVDYSPWLLTDPSLDEYYYMDFEYCNTSIVSTIINNNARIKLDLMACSGAGVVKTASYITPPSTIVSLMAGTRTDAIRYFDVFLCGINGNVKIIVSYSKGEIGSLDESSTNLWMWYDNKWNLGSDSGRNIDTQTVWGVFPANKLIGTPGSLTSSSHEERGNAVFICGDHFCTAQELKKQRVSTTLPTESRLIDSGYFPLDVTLPFVGVIPLYILALTLLLITIVAFKAYSGYTSKRE